MKQTSPGHPTDISSNWRTQNWLLFWWCHTIGISMNWTEDCSLKSCAWEHRDPIDTVDIIAYFVPNCFQIYKTHASMKKLTNHFRYRLYAYYCSHWHFSCFSYMTTPSCRTWIWLSYHTHDTQIDQSLDWFRLSPMVFRILCTIPKKVPSNWLYI